MTTFAANRHSPWVSIPRPLVQPRHRLLCLPHAGAGASLYASWAEPLQKAGIELRSVQYPGRENRVAEPLIANTAAMISALVDAWVGLSRGKPVALFGHSMGALLAHELALALVEARVPNPPTRLFISGRNPPTIPSKSTSIYQLPDREFLNAVSVRHNRLPQELLEDPEMSAVVAGVLRADFTILDTYEWRERPPCGIPLTVLSGTEDPWVAEADLAGWAAQTTQSCRIRMIPGDHFFHQSNPAQVLAAIVADL